MGLIENNIPSLYMTDCEYMHKNIAASYLLKHNDEAAIVETNTRFAVGSILKTLEQSSTAPESVKYIIVTHIHLDHSGGTAELLKHLPNARVLAHSRAARHIIDPARLVESSKSVYGEKKFEELYGVIEPVEESRVQIQADGSKVNLGNSELQFFDTRGHANHHFVILDKTSELIFTGDSFGLAYPMLQQGTSPFIFVSTTPTDFNAEEARKSIDLIQNSGARYAALTHFGIWEDLKDASEQLKAGLDQAEAVVELLMNNSMLSENEKQQYAENNLWQWFDQELKLRNLFLNEHEKQLLNNDVTINAMGLVFAANKNIKKMQNKNR